MNSDASVSPAPSPCRQAQRLIAEKQPAQARVVLEAHLALQPRDVEARVLLSGVLLDLGDLRAATAQLLEAVPALPDEPALIAKLARYLFLAGESVAARACFDHPTVAATRSGPALANLGYVRQMLGESAPALELMERAHAAGVDSADLHYYLGLLCDFNGRPEQAADHFLTCLAKDPSDGRAMLQWARTQRVTPATQHLEAIRLALRSVEPGSVRHASFEFALYKELEDLGEYDEAWRALHRANGIMRTRNPYNPRYEAALTDAIVALPLGEAGGADRPPPPGPTPIFIVGLPRSGTTLLERVLGNHSSIHPAGELTDFYRQLRWMTNRHGHRTIDPGVLGRCTEIDFAELGRRYLQQTQWRAQGRAYYVDKMPVNFQLVGLIRRALPHAPILHMKREPVEACFSNYKAMFNDACAYSYDLPGLADYHHHYQRLMDHWHAACPGAVLDVSYTALVRQPEVTVRRILAFCGLPFEARCIDTSRNDQPVSTLSSAQVREPIHARGLEDWKRYAAQLEPLREALAGTGDPGGA
ncbi:MAG TPA: sulfotransferase [Frateuria sp.]|uniref:tetratricopeptide repeat-containing sulfotransferase family protein n=1 Tax=Frateuria sp. TaxID=2211372 RepID=UPI002D7F4EEC|nr:sulfotransferase [Frateuria sp.]HET6806604.1 sulfotransferase [Frateuria sp.]